MQVFDDFERYKMDACPYANKDFLNMVTLWVWCEANCCRKCCAVRIPNLNYNKQRFCRDKPSQKLEI